MFLVKKDFVKLIMTLRAVFKMLILAPHLALHISSTAHFSLVQLIARRFVIAKFAESIDPFEEVRRCFVQCSYIEKVKKILFKRFISCIVFYTILFSNILVL